MASGTSGGRITTKTTSMALRVAKGLVGGTALAGGTYAGLCYYAIWNAEQRVKRIDVEIVELGKAVHKCEGEIAASLATAEDIKRQRDAMAKKVDGVRVSLAKAEEQVARLKGDLEQYGNQVAEKDAKIKEQSQQTSLLRRMMQERKESVTVAKEALSAAHKEALRTRREMDPIKRLQLDRFV